MEAEKATSKSCYFVSLTYEDSHLYYKYNDCPASLSKRHYFTFMKELRRELPFKIRFFGCGEYGSESFRPHYHFMLFLPVYFSKAKLSDIITKVWKHGFNTVRDGNSKRMYYIAKYTVKGSSHPFGTEKPFQSSSQKPPIGGLFFENNLALYRDNKVNYFQSPTGRKTSIPRSFENRYKKYIDLIARDETTSPSIIRKRFNQKRGSNRLKDYLNDYNKFSYSELSLMKETIVRRYNNKHKHKLTQV